MIVVHYAGISCDMDAIMKIAKSKNIYVIEDAAQAIESKYKNKYLGTIGDIGCLSFHDTKNITCGEGGALFINRKDPKLIEKAEIIREKGTNRSKFFRGEIDKYTWVDIGSSYLPSDILAAFLFAQLKKASFITSLRRKKYNYYRTKLLPLAKKGLIELPYIPKNVVHNAHIFYILLPSNEIRDAVLKFLNKKGIPASFHYVPLHSSPVGTKLGNKVYDLPITTDKANRLLRLPIYSEIKRVEQDYVINILTKALRYKS